MTTEHSPGSLVTTLDMMRSNFAGSILILEGEDDRRFWQRRIDRASCRCALAGAKNTLLLAVQRLESTGFLTNTWMKRHGLSMMRGCSETPALT